MRSPHQIMTEALKRVPDEPADSRDERIVGAILHELAIETCVPQADEYKRNEQTTRSQAMCYGEGVQMGFFAGWLARHYFATDFRDIDRNVFDAVKLRFPLLAERIDTMMNAWSGFDMESEGESDANDQRT